MKPSSKTNNEGINKSTNTKDKKIIKKIKGKNTTNNVLNTVKKNNNLKSKKTLTIEVQLNRNHSEAKKGFIKKLNLKNTKGKVQTQLSQPKIKILLNSKNNNNNNKVIVNKNLKNIKRPLSSKLADDKTFNKLNQEKGLKAINNKINNIKRLNLKQERNKNKSQDCMIRNIKNPKINNLKKKDNSYCSHTPNKNNNSLSKINNSNNNKIHKIPKSKEINNKSTLNNSKGNNKIKNLNNKNVGKNKKIINNKKTNNDSKISKNKTNSNIKKIPINKEANNNKKIPKNKTKFNNKDSSVKNIIKKDQNYKKEKSIKNKNKINNKEKGVKSNDKNIKKNSNNANNNQKENNINSGNVKKVENDDNNNTNNNKVTDFHKILELSKKECELCHKTIVSHLYKIHYNTHASEVFPWLYIGSFNNACDIYELERIKATYVLNCAYECNNEKLPKEIKELHLKIYDYEEFDISGFFEKANDFINQCKSEKGVMLVHCKLGISRSATLVLAYLIKNLGYTVDSALQFLVQKRDRVNPNKGFIKQLYSYEQLNKETKIEKENGNENIKEKENVKENVKEKEKENVKENEKEKENVKEKDNEHIKEKENVKEKEIEKENIKEKENEKPKEKENENIKEKENVKEIEKENIKEIEKENENIKEKENAKEIEKENEMPNSQTNIS